MNHTRASGKFSTKKVDNYVYAVNAFLPIFAENYAMTFFEPFLFSPSFPGVESSDALNVSVFVLFG